MPTFCRHGRLLENCSICKIKDPPRKPAPSRAARRPSAAAAGRPRTARGRGELRVRKLARTADDGYSNGLVPGIRATADARRLAEEIAFAGARLARLRSDPPGLFGEIARAADPEEAIWLAFLTVYLGPLEGDDPFAGVRAAHVSWGTGELPSLDGAELGPRTSHDPSRGTRTIEAYRAWAARAGSQEAALTGDRSWSSQRRFDRAFERLALPGLGRAGRYDFLCVLGATGVVDLEASSLHLGQTGDPTVVAAKRVFGIGDVINLQRRAADLAHETGAPMAALDLALVNWARPEGERITGGTADVSGDPGPFLPALGIGGGQ